MVANVPTAGPETPTGECISIMLRSSGKVLAVVDAERRVIGMVDRADLLRRLATLPYGTPAPTPAPV
jgi:CBS domain-containing protein